VVAARSSVLVNNLPAVSPVRAGLSLRVFTGLLWSPGGDMVCRWTGSTMAKKLPAAVTHPPGSQLKDGTSSPRPGRRKQHWCAELPMGRRSRHQWPLRLRR